MTNCPASVTILPVLPEELRRELPHRVRPVPDRSAEERWDGVRKELSQSVERGEITEGQKNRFLVRMRARLLREREAEGSGPASAANLCRWPDLGTVGPAPASWSNPA